MTDEGFEITVKPLVTLQGLVLVVREGEGEKWRFPEIELEVDEEVDRAAEKGLTDLLDLGAEPHQLVDAVNTGDEEFELYVHLEAEEKDTDSEDREAKWIDPGKLDEYLETREEKRLERREISNFVRKLQSMPSRGDI